MQYIRHANNSHISKFPHESFFNFRYNNNNFFIDFTRIFSKKWKKAFLRNYFHFSPSFPSQRSFILSHEKAVIYPAFIFLKLCRFSLFASESVKKEKKKEVGKILFQEAQGALS